MYCIFCDAKFFRLIKFPIESILLVVKFPYLLGIASLSKVSFFPVSTVISDLFNYHCKLFFKRDIFYSGKFLESC